MLHPQSASTSFITIYQPLSVGMPIVTTSGLSEIVLALADAFGGPQYVANLFALVEMASLLVLARVFYLQTGRVRLMLLGVAAVVLFGDRLQPPSGPEIFGELCFAVMLWILVRDGRATATSPSDTHADTRLGWWRWPATGLLFAVWANLHGSFMLGLVVLACHAAARAVEIGWRTGSLKAVVADRPVQRRTLLAEFALVASLLNPYGVGLLIENVRLLGDANLRAMPQWAPLSLPTLSGVMFLTSFGLLAVVLRHSRRQVGPADVLLLTAFTAAAIPTSLMLSWYAIVFVFVMMPHVGQIATRWISYRASVPEGNVPEGSVPEGNDPTSEETGELTERGETIIAHTPMGEFGKPENLAGAALWLASDASRFVTGIVVPVDGGFSAYSGV